MKKKLALLFVVIMLMSCMPVMAVTVPAGADTAAASSGTVSISPPVAAVLPIYDATMRSVIRGRVPIPDTPHRRSYYLLS